MKLLTLAALLAVIALGHSHAQSSIGIGVNEATVPATGLFAGSLAWINGKQQEFYHLLTGALRAMRDGSDGVSVLIGLSFAYGVFHAAGPGHGKAVISSYMLANEVALRRGIMLSFASATLQAVTAIAIMGAVFLVLRGTAVSMTDTTHFLEIASYALITTFGAWLLWRKAWPLLRPLAGGNPIRSLSAAQAGHVQHDHHRAPSEVCTSCGHTHAPAPMLISGDRFNWKTAWTAIMAVGLRPCTGALVVLSFAFLNGLWAGGMLSVFAMAFGTAVTVSVLATLAVSAKNWAVAFAGNGRIGGNVHAAIEIAGASLVLLLGLTLLTASLSF